MTILKIIIFQQNFAEFDDFRLHFHSTQIDMVDEYSTRWPHYSSEIPKRMGNIGSIDKFDAQFFGVHYKQANAMDPQGRILIEKAYEAILDAGINPKSIRETRTGVFIGACFAEAEKTWYYDRVTEGGFGITGYFQRASR